MIGKKKKNISHFVPNSSFMLLNSLEWVHVCVEEGQYFSEFHLAGQCKTTASITDIGKGSSLTKATHNILQLLFSLGCSV